MTHESCPGSGSDITLVIPTYQRAETVGRAIESALAQVPVAPSIIVVDDGSTDETAAVVARFGSRIQVILKANGGVSSARNAGLAQVATPWTAFLDSDDALYPGALQAACEVLAGDVDACLLSALAMEDGVATDRVMSKPGSGAVYTLRGLFGPDESYAIPTGVFPTAAAREVDGFDERLPGGEDYLFLTRLVARGTRLGILRGAQFEKEEGDGLRLSVDRATNIRNKLAALRLFRELEPAGARSVSSAIRDREGRYLARIARLLPTLPTERDGTGPDSRRPAQLLFQAWRKRPQALDVGVTALLAALAPGRFYRRQRRR